MNHPVRQFASDNYSGICPEALDYLLAANQSDMPAYGNDDWTQRAADQFRQRFVRHVFPPAERAFVGRRHQAVER